MNSLKKTVAYCKRLRDNEIDHGDILSYRLVPIMRKTVLWWTDEEDKNVSKCAKVIYMLLAIRFTTCMILSLLYLGMHWDSKPFLVVLEEGIMITCGLVESSSAIIFPNYRKRTSALLKTINEVNLGILHRNQNGMENRKTSNRLFLVMSFLCIVFVASGSMILVIYVWEFAHTGLPQFNSFLHQPAPYSVTAFIDEISFYIAGYWIMSLCTFYLTMYIEFILRISFYFRVTAGEMRQLRSGVNFDEDQEMKKLKSLIKDLKLLYWCIDEYNETLRIYILLFFLLAFTTFGIFAAVILSIGSIMESLKFLIVPLYLFLFTVAFCAIGQHLKDSADEVRVGIYDCDWYSAPMPFRKLVLNVLTRCTRDVLFSASPLYNIDLILLASVVKTTYSVLAVFGNVLK